MCCTVGEMRVRIKGDICVGVCVLSVTDTVDIISFGTVMDMSDTKFVQN